MFSISVTGVDSIIKRLESYTKNLEEKNRTFMERLAQIGIDTATLKFGQAQYDGTNDVTVEPIPRWEGDNKLYVAASGSSILFIEFGTGVHYSEQHELAGKFGFVRGTYGKGHGSQDTWGYYGEPGTNGRVVERKNGSVVLTHGNPPNRAMYDAAKDMRDRMLEIAREVYCGD